MTRRAIALLFSLLLIHVAANETHAQADQDRPSLLEYGGHGLATGGIVGLSASYLWASADGSTEWRPLAFGASIGALAGISTGFAVGFSDVSSKVPRGRVVLRDMHFGALLGAVAGSLAGVLVWLDRENGQPILQGSAIGALSGAALGMVYGLFESAPSPSKSSADAQKVHVTLGATPTATGELTVMGAAFGRF